jgi:hypothetical protein
MMMSIRTLMTVALALLLLPGCQPDASLEPVETGEAEGTGSEVAQSMAGISIDIDSDAWEGDPTVAELMTPIKVEITNTGDHDLWLGFRNFALLGAYDRYSVLPVFAFQNVDGQEMLIEGYAPVELPEFSHESYYVADYYGPAYPGIATWEHSLVLDEGYYGRYAVSWAELPVPKEVIQRLALPEGVLPPGSSVSGFLFFEGLHPAEERVNFLAQLEDVTTGDYFGSIMIPFEVEAPFEP